VPFYSANVLVAAVAAVVILVPGVPLLSIALNANVLATVLLPVTLVFMVMLASDRRLMGRWANGRLINGVAALIVAFVSVCGAASTTPGSRAHVLVAQSKITWTVSWAA